MRVLFVTWDGAAQSYVESLFAPIFAALRARGVETHILQFSDAPPEHVERTRAACVAAGLGYVHHRLVVRPRALAAAAWVLPGALRIATLVRELGIDVVMPRAIVPAAMALAARPLLGRTRLVWDADGLPADERVEFAGWSPSGLPYRAFRAVERATLGAAPVVLCRTAAAARILEQRRPPGATPGFVVVPNARDERLFRPLDPDDRAARRAVLGIEDDTLVFTAVGSLAPQYHPDAVVALVRAVARRRKVRLIVLTGHEVVMHEAVRRGALDPALVQVLRVPADDVPGWLQVADVGVALREPSFSQQAVAPIKVSEYLLCGLPVVATRGVGDVEALVGDEAGWLLVDVTERSIEELALVLGEVTAAALATARVAARERGVAACSMATAVQRYMAALEVGVAPAEAG